MKRAEAMKRGGCTVLLAWALYAMGCGGSGVARTDPLEQGPVVQSQTFSGTVKDTSGAAVVGARVTVNGITRLTGSTGQYFASVADSGNGYRVDIRKDGFGPATEFRLTGALGLVHVLQKGYTKYINPLEPNDIVEPATNIRVNIPPNSLRSNFGPAQGSVRFTIIPHSSQTMPGDFTARNGSGRTVALISVGAATLQAVDGQGNTLGLAPGATMFVNIPVPGSAGGNMPSCVLNGGCRAAIWRFNPPTAQWIEQPISAPTFTTTGTNFTVRGGQTGGETIDPADGLGTWNADIEFENPACTVIELTNIPLDCYNPPPGATPEPGIEVSFTQALSGGGTKSKTAAVRSSAAFLVLYNIRANVNVDLSFTFPPGAPAYCAANMSISSVPGPSPGFPTYGATGGATQLSTGAPWGGTGYPTDSGGNPIDLNDVVLGDHPCNSFVQVATSP